MEPEQIVAGLAYSGDIPRDAIAAAEARREEMIPLFIEAIEAFLRIESPSVEEVEASPVFVIALLLGEWRATAAYRPFCRLLRADEDVLYGMFGDAGEYVGAITGNLFDGDPQPIYDVILDPMADQFARGAMFQTLVKLAVDGRLARAQLEDFVRSVHDKLEPRFDNMVWDGWATAVALLVLDDLVPEARRAVTDGRMPHMLTSVKHFNGDLTYAKANRNHPWLEKDEPMPLPSAIAILETFIRDEPSPARPVMPGNPFDVDAPAVNPLRHVGRNDPCPCGSGKKFKKCCLDKTETDVT